MDAEGIGLYEDQAAADLRQRIALLTKTPIAGERLLGILLSPDSGGLCPTHQHSRAFWLVAADQFERHGVHCPQVFQQALSVMESGADIDALRSRGVGERGLAKRRKILQDLETRIRAMPAKKATHQTPKPPDRVVQAGEVYGFPTWSGRCANPWLSDKQLFPIPPDAWGALLVVECGRAFDWLPWCAVAALSIDPSQPADMDQVLASRLVFSAHSTGATLCVPNRVHLQRMKMQHIGTLALDGKKAHAAVSRECSAVSAVHRGWSISTAAWGANLPSLARGASVASLLATDHQAARRCAPAHF